MPPRPQQIEQLSWPRRWSSKTKKTPYWRSDLRNVSLWIKPETLPEGWVVAKPNDDFVYYNIFTDETAKTIPEIRELEKSKTKQ